MRKWNWRGTPKKNQMSDVKGKEREQDRSGKIKNEDIDRSRTKHNYDLVRSNLNLYQRVKARVEDLKKEGSRVQKNSVVMYSNILTVSEEQANAWGGGKNEILFPSLP
ncbi:plasmid recombination protein [Virgibacillus halophilus]|uniref:Plasmid recombination protein n=1 Tax=Tigheibacillus halophilus TaxID=361280 RepID=A0ABU5C2H4_9BACI|nr:plasmid recombination protein [Virgibacillus halophilus]